MHIRPVRQADYAQWLSLWRGYQAFYNTNINESVTTCTWSRFLDMAEPVHCAVAELDARLIGIVHYIEHRSCWTEGNYLYLQDLFVDQGARGKGVGRSLIDYVYAKAGELKAARVWWLTHESNDQAMRLYDQIAEKSGFVHYRKIF